MKALLDDLLPRFYPELSFQCIPHEGKSDLEKSIPRKLRGWGDPKVRFIVLRDNDGGDCHILKGKLVALCDEGRRPDTLVRIVCQELEAWYFGEPEALACAYGDESLRNLGTKARYRNPDAIITPSKELEKAVPTFQKVDGARRMAAYLTREDNRSRSFQVLMESIERIITPTEG